MDIFYLQKVKQGLDHLGVHGRANLELVQQVAFERDIPLLDRNSNLDERSQAFVDDWPDNLLLDQLTSLFNLLAIP